jgi:hypothetical protein
VNAQERAERRERIATAALHGLLANASIEDVEPSWITPLAVDHADALIAELDRVQE